MITIAVLAFREFFEAFLIAGIFYGVSKRFELKRESEILKATILGLIICFILPISVFLFGEHAKSLINEKNAELVEGYLLIFSGLFIAYVVFSLHRFLEPTRQNTIRKVKDQMVKKEMFSMSLFLTIFFFIAREGFEIALLSAATTVFSGFLQNLAGLFIGFIAASIVGIAVYFSYIKTPVCKIFRYTEYTIVLFGAAMVKNGISELAEVYFDLHLNEIFPVSILFLPAKDTFLGHAIKHLMGFERNFSLISFTIMTSYITILYFLFFRAAKSKA